jgi:hypothetical protein
MKFQNDFKRMMLGIVSKSKVDMYKYLNELKEDTKRMGWTQGEFK